jgi:hypothetical protein
LRLIDGATLAKLLFQYHVETGTRSVAGFLTGEFDPSPAYVFMTYVPRSGVSFGAVQPTNPIGPALGGGLFAPAVGDQLPDRSEYAGAGGVLYRKVIQKWKDGKTTSFWIAVEGG